MAVKIKSFLKDNKYIFISGGAALFIIMLVYFCYSINPFGDRIIYRMDLYHQYGPLFSELYDRLTSGESLLYSWNSGLGSSFLGNLYNYLSSPLSFIILLFGHENTFEAVAVMIALKAVLSSMSMANYLKRQQNADGPIVILFGILYAFCGYYIAYYWNVMWIDAMYLLPFVVMGIERIIDNGKCKTYIIALILSIFTNYYIGFMICIFSCVYFLYYYYCSLDKFDYRHKVLEQNGEKKHIIKNNFFLHSGVKFAFSSLAAAGVLIFMLLPVAYVLSSSSATSSTFPEETSSYFGFFDFIANHLASLEPTIRSSGEDVLPNVYCGIITLILIPLYLCSEKISLKEKVASVALLAFFYFSFNINLFNFIWHGLHFPNDLPYRQSFMYSFILLIMAYKALKNISEYKKFHIVAIGVAVIVLILVIEKVESKNVYSVSVLLSIIFAIIFTIVLAIMSDKKYLSFSLSVVLVCAGMSEYILGSTDRYVANQTKASFTEDYDDFKAIQGQITENDDEAFYRSELTDLRTRMDPSWYDYNGSSVFSSMAYEAVASMQKDLGMYGNNINSFTYNPQTPVYNSMFSIKYLYDRKNLIDDSEYYSVKANNDTYTAYMNNYHLSIAYPVSKELIGWSASKYNNPVEAQEELFRLGTGVENVYKSIYDYEVNYENILPLDIDSKLTGNMQLIKEDYTADAGIKINITANSGDNIFIYAYSRKLDTVTVTSEKLNTTMDVSDGYILDLGHYDIGDVITLDMPISEDEDYARLEFYVFTVNNPAFVEGYNILKSGQLKYTEFDDTYISGTFTADENEILFTSIPYDNGWNICIDGEKVPENRIIKISDALIGVYVDEGEHNITFKYSIPGLNTAFIVSALFAVLLLALFVMHKKEKFIFKNRKPNIWEKSEGELITETPDEAEINREENITEDKDD